MEIFNKKLALVEHTTPLAVQDGKSPISSVSSRKMIDSIESYSLQSEAYYAPPQIDIHSSESADRNEAETFIDIPTNTFPRLISNGIFPRKSNEILEYKTIGRQSGDMENVAVLIESTNWNDTNRWISSIISQRKSIDDLNIFLYTPPMKISGVSNNLLRSWSNSSQQVHSLKQTSWKSALKHIQKSKEYVIFVRDNEYGAEDFADYYFLGKTVIELNENIESVCGSSNGIWQNYELGDVLWLSNSKCSQGEMRSRRNSQIDFKPRTEILLRPEVARVGNSEKSIVRDNSWNIDHFKPTMMTKAAFDMRLDYDLGSATVSTIQKWDSLKTFDCSDSIYVFSYDNEDQLRIVFENMDVTKLHKYNGIVPLSLGNCRAYIVTQDYLNKNTLPFFDYDG
uniref:DPPIV_N domain-containing protein n=2 Tax=Caenorhabditis tropicalis TaxID=1561998 RepID=A0A1I7V090_9PELO